tara:strand:+ start:792 stop:1019 length:228 start_codon:yes stop_codon:yes gene_type:complete
MYKVIMGLLNKISITEKSKSKSKKNPPIDFTLDTKEIQILLQGIQNTVYKGKDIEMMYSLVLKLQNLYTKSLDNK